MNSPKRPKPPKPTHLVERIRFSLGTVECRCGWVGMGDGPEMISEVFQTHRREMTGKPRSALSMNLRAVDGETDGWY